MGIWSTKWPDGIKNGLLSDFWRWSVTNMPPESHVVLSNGTQSLRFEKSDRSFVQASRLKEACLEGHFMPYLRGYTSFSLFLPLTRENAPFNRVYPPFWGLRTFPDPKKSDPKMDLRTSKSQKNPVFSKKNVKNGYFGILPFWTPKWPKMTHFGPQNDPKWPILTHFGPQNDQKWPILDPKMAIFGFFPILIKKGVLYMQKVAFWPFFDPFLAHFWAHFGP